jgi:uncharacterized protein YdgA (DUF945 family)
MKKYISAIVLLLLIVLAGSPYYVSMQVQSEYEKSITALNQYYTGQVTVTGTYNRGFFTSNATTEIKFTNSPEVLTLKHEIHNGPFIIDTSSGNISSYIPKGFKLAVVDTVIQSQNLDALIKNVYKDKSAYTITTNVNFNGSGDTTLINNPFTMNIGAGEINWKGMSLTIQHAKSFASFDSTLSIPQFSYMEMTADLAKKNEFRIVDVTAKYTAGSQVQVEKLDFSIASISITQGTISVFDADKIAIKGDYSRANKVINSDVVYSFDKLILATDEYGPMQLKAKLTNFDIDTFDTLTSKIAADHSITMTGTVNVHDVLNKLRSYLTPEQVATALSAMPYAEFDLALTTPKGKLNYTSNIVVGDKNLSSIDYDTVMATVVAKISFQIDQPLAYAILAQTAETSIANNEKLFAQQNQDPNLQNPYTLTPEQRQPIIENWIIRLLDKLKDSKVITEKDKVISSEWSYEKGVLTINSKIFSQQDLDALKPLFEIKLQPKVIMPAQPMAPATVNTQIPGTGTTAPSTAPQSGTTPITTTPAATPSQGIVAPQTPVNPNASITSGAEASEKQ